MAAVVPVEFSRELGEDGSRVRVGNRVQIEQESEIVSETNPLPVDCVMVTETAWVTPVNAQVFNAVLTAYNSDAIDVEGWNALNVLIEVESTLAPTDVRVLAQVSHDGGATWWDFEEGLWASLFWEDTDTATAIHKAYLLPLAGHDLVRFRVIATGTDANNRFEVTVLARAFRGPFGVAHA